MSPTDYEYNDLEGAVLKVKLNLKKKGNEYGILNISTSQIKKLAEIINLMTSSPQTKPEFSQKIEKYLSPRFNEILGIIYVNKTLPDQIGIEFSKENQKEILKGFGFASVLEKLKDKKVEYEEIFQNMKNMKMAKFPKT
ncbi:MAG: hypothetical protein EAX91_04685 [Candidatus Lokiarchaeota archaeon]|nr:hypothetical protein [Candidatus Lokiarchaeota archaeon]